MDAEVQAKKRITELTKEINRHRELYHTLDTPEISDQAYDSLVRELEDLEKQFPTLALRESPTNKVGAVVLEKFRKITHRHPQWSFDDVFSAEGLEAWCQRGKKILEKEGYTETPSYVCELKIDGLKVILTYKKGVFVSGATRGDGVVGEDITENLLVLESFPKKLKEEVDCIAVGEAWLHQDTFLALNREREKNGEPLFANPRNAAAGSLRQLDTSVTKKRKLEVFLYEIDELQKNGQKEEIATQQEVVQKLKSLGFPINENQVVAKNTKEIEAYYQAWAAKKDSVPYDLDGIVIKVNERHLQKVLGYTGKSPRFGVAYKFPAVQTTSILQAVHWQVGRTGALTPVASITPTKIAGTTVSRASLHNYDEIERLDVRIGDTVIIQKAGDIIPEVVEVVTALRPKKNKKITEPTNCPVCHSSVARGETLNDETASIYCTNGVCPARITAGLTHAVSRKALNIPGFGGKTGGQLLTSGLVQDIGDLYLLTKEEVLALPRFAEKSTENLIQAIAEAKAVPASRLLFALGIRFVGEETAILITDFVQKNYAPTENQKPTDFFTLLEQVSMSEWESINGVGIRVAESIVTWFDTKANQKIFEKLEKAGVQVLWAAPKKRTTLFSGETWVLTGELDSFTREEASDIIKENGGTVAGSVSGKTTYVLVGKDPGSKAKKARDLGIPTVSEAQFQQRLNSGT